jgi:hypothetical protein
LIPGHHSSRSTSFAGTGCNGARTLS